MQKRARVAMGWRALTLMSALGFAGVAAAAQWNEAGDAGFRLPTAQLTSGPGTLDTINGTMGNGSDVDLYQIYITEPSLFSATTSGGDSSNDNEFDAVLALFDAEGFGVYFNDDRAPGDGNAGLPSANPLGPQAPGFYYIAIFDDRSGALSGTASSFNDLIFPFVSAPFTAVVGPTGPGGNAPLTNWAVDPELGAKPFSGAGYQIFMTGARFADDTTPAGPILSAVLPASRSVQVGSQASAFASIINAGATTATDCSIAPLTAVQGGFTYQTTNSLNQLIGNPDEPASIPATGTQNYFFSFTPTQPLSPTDVQLLFDCTNTDQAMNTVGLNTLLLVADSNPVPDIVALAETVTRDGIANVSGGSGVFSVATVNVGITGEITVRVDTGIATLPITIAVCETNPLTAACINPTAPTFDPVTTTIEANETPTFSFFINSTGEVPFDPANNRIFARFQDAGGVTRGATSVAVRTQ